MHKPASPGPEALFHCRKAIDAVDETILDLVNARLLIARRIGKIKKAHGEGIVDPVREEEILRRLADKNPGPLTGKDLEGILRILMDASRAIQAERALEQFIPEKEATLSSLQYRPRLLDAETRLFGVIGNPVSHSLSPVMHNRALAATGVNGAYLAFPVRDLPAAIRGLRSLGAKGISVTLPFKVAVMEHLDKIHESAAAAGAVNTIVNRGGELTGYNTDGEAAVTALLEKTPINGKTAAVIGAGGAARSIGAALSSAGARLIICNRSVASGKRLARRLNAEFTPLSEFDGKGCHILVNATPVGMWPRVAATPVPKEAIRPEMVVMDIVYRPLQTRLLREAKAQGAFPVDGVSMFVHQGARQFELWTGKKAPVSEMQQAVLEVLSEGEETS